MLESFESWIKIRLHEIDECEINALSPVKAQSQRYGTSSFNGVLQFCVPDVVELPCIALLRFLLAHRGSQLMLYMSLSVVPTPSNAETFGLVRHLSFEYLFVCCPRACSIFFSTVACLLRICAVCFDNVCFYALFNCLNKNQLPNPSLLS